MKWIKRFFGILYYNYIKNEPYIEYDNLRRQTYRCDPTTKSIVHWEYFDKINSVHIWSESFGFKKCCFQRDEFNQFDDNDNIIYSRDYANNIEEQWVYDNDDMITYYHYKCNDMDIVRWYKYDANGNEIYCKEISDGEAIESFSEYDEFGNVIKEYNSIGYECIYTYDEKHRLISSKDSNGNIDTWTYDDNGDVIHNVIRPKDTDELDEPDTTSN